jgi:hypothetical protein
MYNYNFQSGSAFRSHSNVETQAQVDASGVGAREGIKLGWS